MSDQANEKSNNNFIVTSYYIFAYLLTYIIINRMKWISYYMFLSEFIKSYLRLKIDATWINKLCLDYKQF